MEQDSYAVETAAHTQDVSTSITWVAGSASTEIDQELSPFVTKKAMMFLVDA